MDNQNFDDPLRSNPLSQQTVHVPYEEQQGDRPSRSTEHTDNTSRHNTEPTLQNEPPVMGGQIGSLMDSNMIMMDHHLNSSSNNEDSDHVEANNDPGIITDFNHDDSFHSPIASATAGYRYGEPIVIDAEKYMEEHASSRNQEKHPGVIQSLFKNPFSAAAVAAASLSTGSSSISGSGGGSNVKDVVSKVKTLDAKMKATHEDYKRKYMGIPLEKDASLPSAVVVTAASAIASAPSLHKHRTLNVEPCNAKFLVTKLRSWRTGYCRILSLHKTYFTTIDPDIHEITNLWYYAQVRHCIALPQEEDCILMDVLEEDQKGVVKLKFKCVPKNRNDVMTALMENLYLSEKGDISKSYLMQQQEQQQQQISPGLQHVIFPKCQRLTRHNKRVDLSLLCAPHGIIELDRVTGMPIRTYYYKCIRGVCFLGDDVNGVAFYMNETNNITATAKTVRCECKVWFVESSRVGGSGRSEILTVLKNKCAALAMPLTITESLGLPIVNEIRKARGTASLVGEWICSFRVTKFSQRRLYELQGKEQQQQQQHQDVELILTRGGYIVELDIEGGVKSSRSLRDVICIVKHNDVSEGEARKDILPLSDKFTIEFKGGLRRTYSSDERDTVIVSILDITIYTCKNVDVTVTDVPSYGYNMLCFSEEDSLKDFSISTTQNIFQSDPIEIQCLKLLHEVAVVTNAIIQYSYFVDSSVESRILTNECVALIECCREFNANVRLRAVNNMPDDRKLIEGTIKALWDSCLTLLDKIKIQDQQKGPIPGTRENNQDKEVVLNLLVPIFQSLYRLMMTEVGYSTAAENKEMVSCVKSISEINNNLALYWFLKCLSALILPRPFVDERDKRNEFMNKSILLDKRTGIISSLVGVIVGSRRNRERCEDATRQCAMNSSDLVIMVASNIIESILCSHRETTPSEKINDLIQEIRDNQNVIIDMLTSSASIIVENAVVILQILSNQYPDTARVVRHSGLISGMLLCHFYHAIFSCSEGQRHISRFLCTLWMSGRNGCVEKLLLHRLVPTGFSHYLSMPMLSEEEENQLDQIEKGEISNGNNLDHSELSGSSGTNIERFRSRIRKALSFKVDNQSDDQKENFRILFHVLNQDHSLPDLIWNDSTRNDLRKALETELGLINAKITQYGLNTVAWNYEEFAVDYSSLRDEVHVGSVYMRLWLEASDSFIRSWDNPVRLLELLFRRLLCDIDRNVSVANICIRCLERLYTVHFKKIGSFPDIFILVRCMRTTENIETRHRLLSLLTMLIGSNDKIFIRGAECRENLRQLLNEESIQFFCLLSAEAHFGSNSIKNCPLPTDIPALWYIAPPGSENPAPDSVNGPFTIEDLRVLLKNGKINRLHLVSFCYETKDNISHNFDGWEELRNVWQLRRQLLDDETPSFSFSPSMVSFLSLKSLERMVMANDSIDSRGIPYFPIPLAKRIICDDALHSSSRLLQGFRVLCLPIICQCILSQDCNVVKSAASLIRHLISHNEMACRKLYLTGIFFFAFTSNHSDWQCIARMIHQTILTQEHISLQSEAALDRVEDVTNILHLMIPDGLVQVLMKHGPEQFGEVFVGNYDTPEVIWSKDMREYLRSVLLKHLGDFPARLRENCIMHYEYCPLEKVCYDRLQNEIFCHGFYLGNLCNEQKFPNWPIKDPLALLNACIELWESLEKQNIDNQNTLTDKAIPNQRLNEDANEEDLKTANRGKSSKYHPVVMSKIDDQTDLIQGIEEQETLEIFHEPNGNVKDVPTTSRNSSRMTSESTHRGREDFHNDQEKDEYVLLMKAQILICKRYSEEIGNFKYSAYRTLLLFVKRILESHDLDNSYTAKLMHTAMNLLFYSCLVSPLNAEELIREGGVLVLAEILRSYVKYICSLQIIEKSCNDLLLPIQMETLVHVVHTIAGISYYESGRQALESLPDFLEFFYNWQTCVDLHSLGGNIYGCNLLKRYALEGVINMVKTKGLQRRLSKSSVVWNLIQSCLDYDPSIELSSPDTNQCQRSLSKVELNYCGGLAGRALGMLCGVMDGEFSSPPNQSLFNLMKHVLTPPIATMLRSNNTEKLLRTLNVVVKSPIIMWDINMKEELKSFVSHMESTLRSKKEQSLDEDVVKRFKYSNLSDQIIVGGVYVRMFNDMDLIDLIKDIPSMPVFVHSLVKFVGRSIANDIGDCDAIDRSFVESRPINDLDDKQDDCVESIWCPITDDKFVVCLKAVLRLAKADGIFDEILCEAHSAGILLSLMRVDSKCECFPIAIEILAELCPKQTFAEAVLKRGLIPWYLTLLEFLECQSSEDTRKKNPRWSVLEFLVSCSAVATHLVNSSGWLELLALVVGCERFTTVWFNRNGSAQVLAQLLCDPQVSSIAASKLQKFIPPGLVTTLKKNGAEAMILTFDKDNETPELIWDGSMRFEVRNIISDVICTIFDADNRRVTQNKVFSLPSEFHFSYNRLKGEVCIGGVYLRLFLKLQSSCQLQDPTGFLESLLFKWATELESANNRPLDNEMPADSDKKKVIDLVTEATLLAFELYPFLRQKVSSWGYTKQIVHYLIKSKLNNLLDIHLISCFRLLLAVSSDLSIVEDIILLTDSQGTSGVVDAVMKAIDGNPLHYETALMVETLKLTFKTALGDLDNCTTAMNLTMGMPNYDTIMEDALTPSPASGKESVSKMKMAAADHPLAMMVGSSAPSAKKKTISVRPSRTDKHLFQSERYRAAPSTTRPSSQLPAGTVQRYDAVKSAEAYKNSLCEAAPVDTIDFSTMRHLNDTHNLSRASIMETKKSLPECYNRAVDNAQSCSTQEVGKESDLTSSAIGTSLNFVERSTWQHLNRRGAHDNVQDQHAAFMTPTEASFTKPLLYQTSVYPENADNHQNDSKAFLPYAITSDSVDALHSNDSNAIAQNRMISLAGAPNSARGRCILLDSALACELPQFLVMNILENPRFEFDVKDSKSTKLHVIELLQLLLKDPGYGLKFKIVLESMPTWNLKYIQQV